MTRAISRASRRGLQVGIGAFLLVAVLARCTATDLTGPVTPATNLPAVGMSAGQFGFAVTARDWTYDQSYAPDLSNGTLQIGLVVAGYATGAGTLTVTDASGASVFSQSLAGNVAQGNNASAHGTPPFHIHVATTHYTGTISLGVSASATPAGAPPAGRQETRRPGA